MRRITLFDAVIMAGGLGLLLFGAHLAGPALAAALGKGTQGTYTAVRSDCFVHHPGKVICTWRGDFRSDDGKDLRKGVTFYDSMQDSFTAGRTVRAFDTGQPDHVYSERGSREWIIVALILAAGAALVARPLLPRRRPHKTAGQPVPSDNPT